MVIVPTVGRVVWFYPNSHEEGQQPFAGLVTFVHHERNVNLAVFNSEGEYFPARNVILVQEGDDQNKAEQHATWMPYQVGQAKKDSA